MTRTFIDPHKAHTSNHIVLAQSILFAYVLLLSNLLVYCGSSNNDETHFVNCRWNFSQHSPHVYFVNMNDNHERRQSMNSHLSKLGLSFKRVQALSEADFVLPDNVKLTWRTSSCTFNSALDINTSNVSHNFIVQNLCGFANEGLSELGCTLSHLAAIKMAVHSKSNPSKYALIIEDDVFFPFSINFNQLIESAPMDFGILQLYTNNLNRMNELWSHFLRNGSSFWEYRQVEDWSTGAYLINREVIRPVIDLIVKRNRHSSNLHFNVLAVDRSCNPSTCCDPNHRNLCIQVDRRLVLADYFIYALAKSYITSLPIVTNGDGWSNSSIHQGHVTQHGKSFQQQLRIIKSLYDGSVKSPSFIQAACG